MRILLLSDLHANWTALQAVHRAEPEFDVCLILGDLVDFGPQPGKVIAWVKEYAAVVIRGNHDQSVAQFVQPHKNETLWHRLRNYSRILHWKNLSTEDLNYLSRLPVRKYWTCEEGRFLLIHASPRDPLHEYLPDEKAIWKSRLQGIEADYVCVGHSHRPYQEKFGSQTLINPGSVGQQKMGECVANYVVIEDGVPDFRQVDFEIEELISDFEMAGYDQEIQKIARMVYSKGFAVEEAVIPQNGKILSEEGYQ
ncbi:metallophosphoesterase family protein [Rubinisphaera sp.]|uniref:metallophosphoesterase family protein n=1 Tax=Rubinisphaera sp. TaxID=2024857 RepID=UPI000C0EC536|nr:metallophosphoesterase family protein [Rubinisphaera sp.]MBV09742.1 YfcE family phosphodiesterase [Rubinisphaera sp.]HCS55165.1 YfcE family phosphodiesterase [Planctomycetaceae bacterium]|tara:strand:- start:321 stop:1079 length:759 start_codon:yes stop_codon:yes gene_type:complete